MSDTVGFRSRLQTAKMAATAMLSSMVCSRIFSLTIKQCPHHKKETKKYTRTPSAVLSPCRRGPWERGCTFSQVFQTYHGPADPEFHLKVWCSERGHEEGHEIDDTETALFNIVDLFPVKYIKFSCLKRAVETRGATHLRGNINIYLIYSRKNSIFKK